MGECNICGDVGPLTDDHTPPKGRVRPTAMTLQRVTSRMAAKPAITAKANDGIRYRPLYISVICMFDSCGSGACQTSTMRISGSSLA